MTPELKTELLIIAEQFLANYLNEIRKMAQPTNSQRRKEDHRLKAQVWYEASFTIHERAISEKNL